MDWDVFISHAWEDKEDIARPLAETLREAGLRVWYDEFTLTLGDSLRRSIDRGLAQSRCGVVIWAYVKLGGERDTTSKMRYAFWAPEHFPERNISSDVMSQSKYTPS